MFRRLTLWLGALLCAGALGACYTDIGGRESLHTNAQFTDYGDGGP